MMKRLIILLVFIALGTVLYISSQDNQQSDSQIIAEEDSGEGGPAIHPISLPALMQKEFDGQDLQLGRVLADNSAYTRYYITYKSGELTISGIMNVPKGSPPFPLLILNHGYIDPAVYTNGRGLKREQDFLARQGYVVIHPDYRNHADSDKDPENDIKFRLGYTEDVINAVLAARNSDLDFIDTDHVGMLGHSMGGGITQNVLVVSPDLIDAAVLFAPVSSNYRDNFDRWIRRRAETAQKTIELYGSPEDSPEFWDDISAASFFSKITAPIMIHHGTIDESVPLAWSERLQSELQTAGKDSTLYIYENEPHEFVRAWSQVMERTVKFFDTHLKS